VQRQESVPPLYMPPDPGDDDASWQDDEAAPPVSRPRSRLRGARFVAVMAAIGAGLALAWHFSGLRAAQGNLAWPSLSSLSLQGPSRPEPEDRFARIAGELEALKKSVSELSAGVQQIAASNAALQASQQELRQRILMPPASSHWYSDPAALRLQFALPQRPAAVAATPRAAPPETTASTRRNNNAPITLRAPQP